MQLITRPCSLSQGHAACDKAMQLITTRQRFARLDALSAQGRQRALTWLGATAAFSSLRALFAGGAARALGKASLRQARTVSGAQRANF